MRRTLVVVAAAVAVLIAVVLLVGALLPPTHVAAVAADFRAPRDSIWATLTDVSAFPRWRDDVTRVEELPSRNGHRAWRETGEFGTITFETVEAEAPHRLVSRIADDSLPFGGSWTYEIAATPAGTTVTITERGEVRNILFRVMSRFVFGHTSTMEGVLHSLGRKFGEAVEPRPVPLASLSARAVPAT